MSPARHYSIVDGEDLLRNPFGDLVDEMTFCPCGVHEHSTGPAIDQGVSVDRNLAQLEGNRNDEMSLRVVGQGGAAQLQGFFGGSGSTKGTRAVWCLPITQA